MSSMLDLVREAVTPDLMRKISAVIGESPGATEKAMGAAVRSDEWAAMPARSSRASKVSSSGGSTPRRAA